MNPDAPVTSTGPESACSLGMTSPGFRAPSHSLAQSRGVLPEVIVFDAVNGAESEVTAVRSALYRGDREAALALVNAGADLNVFDLAALGDVEGLRRVLATDPAAARAWSADG